MKTITPNTALTSGATTAVFTSQNAWQMDETLTLSQAYQRFQTLYQVDNYTKLPWILQFMENPRWCLEFSGAISLYQHDLVHCLIGRGIKPADEAFTIGFTMGSVKTLNVVEIWLYKFVSKYLYPADYRFSDADLITFQQGVTLAKQMPALQQLNRFNPDDFLPLPLKDVRAALGITTTQLIYTLTDAAPITPATNI
ncbi:hypothetical protein [Chitinophaga nivalis]|uniref:Uncharacterized protein n=1 Tax=Chitinophaga nivalis TaxID=2991709 RepID=A0ABT3IKY2_9BACT|nr:hypothetical protein [Chitinophaga nivalis]MCW3465688.1 hypothetical protein [Chitinophaga nivalis]MCW3484621.1 hypothetical protein [Chitinophaga nivalis]